MSESVGYKCPPPIYKDSYTPHTPCQERSALTNVVFMGAQAALVILSPWTAGMGLAFRYIVPNEADRMQHDIQRNWREAPLWQKVAFVSVSCIFWKIAALALGLIAGSARLGFAEPPSLKQRQEIERAEMKYSSKKTYNV